MSSDWTGERLETFILSRDAVEHLHRYAIARTYAKNKKVLDIASGEGYGSNLLSEVADFVYGVDIDLDAIKRANSKYKKKNLSFKQGSTSAIPLEDNSVDLVVSFETIEHHAEHNKMFDEIQRVLKPKGLVIISTPDKYYYSEIRNFRNPFHVKELYKKEFKSLMFDNFDNIQLLNQKYVFGSSIIQDEESDQEIKFYNGSYSKIKEEDIHALYLIAIASDSIFKNQELSIFSETELSKTREEYIGSSIKNSTTFRIGNIILKPFKLLKKYFN